MAARKKTTHKSRKPAELILLVPSKLGLSYDEVKALQKALEPMVTAMIGKPSSPVTVITGVTNGKWHPHPTPAPGPPKK